jgi:hypothetical protein
MMPTFSQMDSSTSAPIDTHGVEEMNIMRTNLQRKNMEEFLHDLICGTRSPEEVGILVDVLMAMQKPMVRAGDSGDNQECPRLNRASVKKGAL